MKRFALSAALLAACGAVSAQQTEWIVLRQASTTAAKRQRSPARAGWR